MSPGETHKHASKTRVDLNSGAGSEPAPQGHAHGTDRLWVLSLPTPWTVLERETRHGGACSRPGPHVRDTPGVSALVWLRMDFPGNAGGVWASGPAPQGGSCRLCGRRRGVCNVSTAPRPRSATPSQEGEAGGAGTLPRQDLASALRPSHPLLGSHRCRSETEVYSRTRILGGPGRPLEAAACSPHSLFSPLVPWDQGPCGSSAAAGAFPNPSLSFSSAASRAQQKVREA